MPVALLLRPRRPPHARQFVAGKAGDKDHVERMIVGKRTMAHGIGDAPAPAEFHGAGIDLVHFRRGDRAVALLDEFAANSAPAKLGPKRQSDRSTADDQHGHITRAPRGGRGRGIRDNAHCSYTDMRSGTI